MGEFFDAAGCGIEAGGQAEATIVLGESFF
jgi:hypothetical protein